jgi:hypothetical protein
MTGDDIKQLFQDIQGIAGKLPAWELQFIDSIKNQWEKNKILSGKQVKILKDIMWKYERRIYR